MRWAGRLVVLPRSGRDCGEAFRLLTALIRGTYYAIYFRLFRRNVRIDLPFLAHARVSIVGPGQVRIGPFCSVYENVSCGLSIVTLSPPARVSIGAHCSIGGLTIRCVQSIEIGDRARTAFSLVQDVSFYHRTAPSSNAHFLDRPVWIGENAWLGAFSVVLPGSVIGEDSVLGWGACSTGIELPAGTMGLGNPISRGLPIARVLALRK